MLISSNSVFSMLVSDLRSMIFNENNTYGVRRLKTLLELSQGYFSQTKISSYAYATAEI